MFLPARGLPRHTVSGGQLIHARTHARTHARARVHVAVWQGARQRLAWGATLHRRLGARCVAAGLPCGTRGNGELHDLIAARLLSRADADFPQAATRCEHPLQTAARFGAQEAEQGPSSSSSSWFSLTLGAAGGGGGGGSKRVWGFSAAVGVAAAGTVPRDGKRAVGVVATPASLAKRRRLRR
jgi:hypothetical protein